SSCSSPALRAAVSSPALAAASGSAPTLPLLSAPGLPRPGFFCWPLATGELSPPLLLPSFDLPASPSGLVSFEEALSVFWPSPLGWPLSSGCEVFLAVGGPASLAVPGGRCSSASRAASRTLGSLASL